MAYAELVSEVLADQLLSQIDSFRVNSSLVDAGEEFTKHEFGGSWYVRVPLHFKTDVQHALVDSDPVQVQKHNSDSTVMSAREFGTDTVTDFLSDNLLLGLDFDLPTSLSIKSMFKDSIEFLELGQLGVAIDAIQLVELYPPIWTQERKNALVAKIQNYIDGQ